MRAGAAQPSPVSRRRLLRRAGAAAAAAGLGLLVAPGAAHAALSGYEISTAADAVAWVPVLPGFVPGANSPGEISLSDTAASLATGGVAYGRGALNYPGSFGAHLGPLLQEEGAPASLAQAIPPWPTLAEASGGSGQVTNSQVPGATIQAFGSAQRSSGDAMLPTVSFPGLLQVASITTHSQSSIQGTTARAASSTVLHDVSLVGGAVTMSAISSSSAVTGTKPSGAVQVSGLRIGGIPATIDASGVHALGVAVPGSDLNQQISHVLKSSGLQLSVAEPITTRTKGTVARQTGGLIVGIDTPESPAASAGVIFTELGATTASVATTAGAAEAGGSPTAGLTPPTGGGPTPAAGGGPAATGGVLPAVLSGGLSSTDAVSSGPGATTSGPPASGAGGAPTVATLASDAYGGMPVAVWVTALLVVAAGSWGLAAWVRRVAAWRGEG